MDTVNSTQEQIGNVSTEMEILRKPKINTQTENY